MRALKRALKQDMKGGVAPQVPMKSAVSHWIKGGLYFATWGAVVLITCLKNPDFLWSASWFPLGLLGLIPNDNAIIVAMLGGPFLNICGWMIYFALTIGIFATKRNLLSWAIFVFFCVLIALNLVGCDRLIKIGSEIE
jgi:hypothetical protein